MGLKRFLPILVQFLGVNDRATTSFATNAATWKENQHLCQNNAHISIHHDILYRGISCGITRACGVTRARGNLTALDRLDTVRDPLDNIPRKSEKW